MTPPIHESGPLIKAKLACRTRRKSNWQTCRDANAALRSHGCATVQLPSPRQTRSGRPSPWRQHQALASGDQALAKRPQVPNCSEEDRVRLWLVSRRIDKTGDGPDCNGCRRAGRAAPPLAAVSAMTARKREEAM